MEGESAMSDTLWLSFGFNLFVLAMLALDLGVFHRKAHVVAFKESVIWTIVWVALAMVSNAGLWHVAGPQKALEFFTGYVIEKSLSVDNVFVFAMLFSHFAVPIGQHNEHRSRREGGADNDEVYTFALVHYLSAGVVVRF